MLNRDLTPGEVESLLSAPECASDQAQGSAVTSAAGTQAEQLTTARKESRATDVPIQDLRPLIAQIDDAWSSALVGPLRTEVSIRCESARQMSVTQFAKQIETPACVQVMSADEFDGFVMLQVDRNLIFAMLDRLLGGGSMPTPLVRRPLTEIEVGLLPRITAPWQDALCRAIRVSRLTTMAIESHVERLPNEEEAVFVFESSISLGSTRGRARAALPTELANRMSGGPWQGAAQAAPIAESLPETGSSVIAGSVQMRRDEAHQLKVGQTVFAENQLPRVYVNRKLLYSGRLGSSGGKKAVQVNQVHDQEE